MRRWFIILLALPLFTTLYSQSRKLTQYEYWIDGDYTSRVTQSLSGSEELINMQIDTREMTEGIHSVCIRVGDERGAWSETVFSSYLVIRPDLHEGTQLTNYEYWFDEEYDQRQTEELQEGLVAMPLDVSSLTYGMHYFCYRILDSNGNSSGTERTLFFVQPAPEVRNAELVTCEYWFDEEPEQMQTTGIQDGLVALQVDASSLIPGIHCINYRIIDTNGNISGTERALFFVQQDPEIRDGEPIICEYWLDEEPEQKQTIGIQDGLVALQIDASSLTSGIHQFCYRISDSKGKVSSTQCSLFFVQSASELANGEVIACEYWIDGDYSQAQEIAVTDENVVFSIDATDLEDGMHSVSLRVKNSSGEYSALHYGSFYKYSIDGNGGTPIICEYWFDNDFANRKEESVVDGNVIFSVETSEQTEGIHTLSWRIKDDKGVYSSTCCSQYYKHIPASPTDNIVWYQYWWNDRIDMAVRKDISAEGELLMEEVFEVPDYVAESKDQPAGKAEFHILFCNDKGVISSITDVVVEDRIPPVSRMNPLPETQVASSQVLSWEGNDKWAGVKDYTVYVYNDADNLWHVYVENISDTTITYYCSRYDFDAKFFVIARDSLDNTEPMKTEAEAQVRFMYVDIYPPTTQLHVSEEWINKEKPVELTWETTDDVNQIVSNNVYYSEDDGPLILWKTVSGTNSVSFKGKSGATYKFIVTGRDSAGNQERPDMSKSVTVSFYY